jgi:hypothetical protein
MKFSILPSAEVLIKRKSASFGSWMLSFEGWRQRMYYYMETVEIKNMRTL